MKFKVLCPMCQCEFPTRRAHAVTCSPRCRKRAERVKKGKAPLTRVVMGLPPNPTASKLWR
jgi:hypothetical protein